MPEKLLRIGVQQTIKKRNRMNHILVQTLISTLSEENGLMVHFLKIKTLLKNGNEGLATYGIIERINFHDNHTNQNMYLYERILTSFYVVPALQSLTNRNPSKLYSIMKTGLYVSVDGQLKSE